MPVDLLNGAGADDSSTLRSSMGRFALLSMLAMVLLALAIAWESSRFAEEEAVHDAREQSRRMATLLAAPLVTAAARQGEDPVADAELERQLRSRVQDTSVSHIVLWDRSGRIIWADDPTLGGRTFTMPAEVKFPRRVGSARGLRRGHRCRRTTLRVRGLPSA